MALRLVHALVLLGQRINQAGAELLVAAQDLHATRLLKLLAPAFFIIGSPAHQRLGLLLSVFMLATGLLQRGNGVVPALLRRLQQGGECLFGTHAADLRASGCFMGPPGSAVAECSRPGEPGCACPAAAWPPCRGAGAPIGQARGRGPAHRHPTGSGRGPCCASTTIGENAWSFRCVRGWPRFASPAKPSVR